MKRLFDFLALSYIRRRLADFRTQADASDLWADKIVLLLQAEIVRRHKLYDGWDRKRRLEVEAACDEVRREAAKRRFEQELE